MDKSEIKNIILKILLYYSTILSTILIVGGFWTADTKEDIISNLLFLPVVVFLWIIFIKTRRDKKYKKRSKDKN